jgi:hypothetical protein
MIRFYNNNKMIEKMALAEGTRANAAQKNIKKLRLSLKSNHATVPMHTRVSRLIRLDSTRFDVQLAHDSRCCCCGSSADRSHRSDADHVASLN